MVPISGIAPGDRLYLRHRSTRLLPSRYMQTVVSTGLASSKDTPHDVRPHSVSPPIEYSTEPADSMESLRIVRDSKPMGEAQGPLLVLATSVVQAVDQHLSARRPPTSVDQRNTARHQRWYTLASFRSLSTSARSYSSPRHTWALTRGIVRGRVVWRHDLAGRSSLGRRALGSSTPRPTPYSSHAAGSPDSTAPAVSRTHLAAAPRLRTSTVHPGPSSKSCCRRRRRRRQLPPSSLAILTT